MGVVINGHWLLQNPLFFGYAGTEGYLPSQKIAIAVAVTFEPEAFGATGEPPNSAFDLFLDLGAALAPDDPPLKSAAAAL